MDRRLIAATVSLTMAAAGAPAPAATLCQRRSGALAIRAACRKHESAVDLASLGLVGPKGDPGEARAYGCSNASGDGTLVTACTGRASKNVTAVVGGTAGETCFVLAPSIDAASAVVVASFNENTTFGTEVNTILEASGVGSGGSCPANSIVVVTARYSYFGGTPSYTLIRLPVNVAVM